MLINTVGVPATHLRAEIDRHRTAIVSQIKQDRFGEAAQYVLDNDAGILSDNAHADVRFLIDRSLYSYSHEFLFMGSVRLGFSLSPKKAFRPFGPESDIDIVIFSKDKFIHLLEFYCRDKSQLAQWDWSNSRRDDDHYIARGWIRPDKHVQIGGFLKDLSREVSEEAFGRRRKVSCAIFASKDIYKSYLSQGMRKIQMQMKAASNQRR